MIWIWKPADWAPEDRRSAIVFYHGGGWRNGNPAAFSRQGRELADLGMVAQRIAKFHLEFSECIP